MGKPYIKELHANKELSIVAIAMLSPSLHFGLKDSKEQRVKQDILTQVTTILAYSSLYNSDIFMGIYAYNNQLHITPSTKQKYTVDNFCKDIYNAQTLNTTLDYTLLSTAVFAKINRPSLVFVIGDFFQEVDLSLLAQKHEVIAIIIRHKEWKKIPKN